MHFATKITKRITAFLLTLLILVGALPLSVSAAENDNPAQNTDNVEYSNTLNGWKISSTWSNYSDTYTWNADSNATQQPKAMITYHIDNLSKTYNVGEMTITVPGIGSSNRASVKEATSVAGRDVESDWTLDRYDINTDTYTFKNAIAFEEGKSVNGGFEIVWTLNSRETTNGYSQSKSVTFSDGDGSITLPPLKFNFTSTRDLVTVSLEKESLTGEEYQILDMDTTWYKVYSSFFETVKARGLNKSKYYVTLTLPSETTINDVKLYAIGTDKHLETKIDEVLNNEITPESLGNNKYGFYLFEDRYGSLDFFSSNFLIGLNKTKFEAKQLGIEGSLECLFNDETEWVDDNTKLNGEIYKVSDTQTVISYSFPKVGPGIVSGNKYFSKYNEAPYSDRLSAQDIYSNAVLDFDLEGLLKLNYGEPVSANRSQNKAPSNVVANKTGSESVGAEIGFKGDMVIGDNLMSVVLKDGSMRLLENSEYDFNTLKLPAFNNNRFRVYVANTRDAYFTDIYGALSGAPTQTDAYGVRYYSRSSTSVPSDGKTYYYCLAEGQLSSRTLSIDLKSDTIKAYYVVIYDVDRSVTYKPKGTVVLHLDSGKELQKDASLRVDPEKYISNYMFFRFYTEENGQIKDIAEVDDYAQTFAQLIKDRDLEYFHGHCLFREADEAWLKSTETVLSSSTVIDEFDLSNRRQFTTTITSNGSIQSGESGTLKKFSMITAVPDVIKVSTNENDYVLEGVTNGTTPINDHVSFRRVSKNGKTYLIADFDYTASPLNLKQLTKFKIQYPATLDYYDFADYGNQYNAENFVVIQDQGVEHMRLTAYKLRFDSADFDCDGNTTERGAYADNNTVIEETAQAWSEYAYKEVKSYYNPTYSKEAITKLSTANATASEQEKSYYTYRLDFGVGVERVKNVVFYDTLENGATIALPSGGTQAINSEWKGSLVEVDTSFLQNHNFSDNRKIIPTIYYSTKSNPARDLNNSSAGWTTTMPANKSSVKAIAVSLDTSNLIDGVLQSGQAVYLTVKMLAPNTTSSVGKKAVNQYYVQYDEVPSNASSSPKHTELPSSETYVKLMNRIGQKTLRKIDADSKVQNDNGSVSYNRLAGAKLQIYDSTGTALFSEPIVMNKYGEYILQNVECGTYYWEEIEAPDGYIKANGRHRFEITENSGEIELIENSREKGVVRLRKGDSDDSNTLFVPGAVYRLYNESGDLLYTTTDNVYSESSDAVKCDFTSEGNDSYVTIIGLPWGKYYFKEYSAPQGYTLSTKEYWFTVGKDSREVYVEAENTEIKSKAVIQKVDAETHRSLSGALYSLEKYIDESWVRWVGTSFKTNAVGEAIAEGLTFGKYRWKEEKAPTGYNINPACVEFEITANTAGKTFRYLQVDTRKKGSARLLKTDTNGKSLKGAVYSLYKENDELVKDGLFTDAYGETETLTGLEWGKYYFKEDRAPNGYKLSNEKIYFTIDEYRAETTQYVKAKDEQQLGSVKLIKTNKYTNEADKVLLANAVFSLYTSENTLVQENLTTNANGEINLSNLAWGSYYFVETQAPSGYSINSDKIRFSINASNASKTQEVTCVNKQGMCEIKVDKVINEQYEAFGGATFIFQVVGTDNEGKEHVYTKSLTLPPGQTSGSIVFSELPHGKYEVREKEVSRYKQGNVTKITQNVSFEYKVFDGTLRYVPVVDVSSASFGEVQYTNNMKQYEKLSHNNQAINILSAGSKLIGITVDYVGENPIKSKTEFSYTFKDTDLVVTAHYDNDTTKIIPFSDYSLSPETVTSADNASGTGYTVDVSYTEDGITVSDSFNVKLDLKDDGRKLRVIFHADSGYSGGYFLYDGTVDNTIDCYEDNNTHRIILGKYKEPFKDKRRFLGWYTSSTIAAASKVGDIKVKQSLVSTEDDELIIYDTSGNPIPFESFPGYAENKKLVEVNLYARWSNEGSVVFEGNNFTIYDNGLMTIQGNGELSTDYTQNEDSTKKFQEAITNVEKIVVNGNVTSVPREFFSEYTNLEEITFPESMTTISRGAFMGCSSLSKVNFTGDITTIDRGAFYNCQSLEEFEIPRTVTSIGRLAFYGCKNLKEVAIPANVQEIGEHTSTYWGQVYPGCTSLEKITVSPENPYFDSRNDCNAIVDSSTNELLAACKNTVIDDSVTSIGDWSYYGHTEIQSVDIPESITSIGQNAFSSSGLTNIFIPKSVQSIGPYAFDMCAALDNASVDPANTVYDSRNNCNAVIETASNKLVVGTSNMVIPSSVTSIGHYSTTGRNNLTRIDIPSNVKTIGTYAFDSCSNLTEVNFSEGLTAISAFAFQNCDLRTVEIPNTTVALGIRIFENNKNLNSVIIPNSVTSFQTNESEYILFDGCDNLETLVIPWRNNVGSAIRRTESIKNLTINYNGVSTISGSTIGPMPNLETVVIGEGITIIDNAVNNGSDTRLYSFFEASPNLKSVVLPNTIQRIGASAFELCQNLETIDFPSSLKEIGSQAFNHCSALEEVDLSACSQLKGMLRAFQYCSSLKEVKFPQNLEDIGERSFLSCSELEMVYTPHGNVSGAGELPSTLKSMGDESFKYCTNLGNNDINTPIKIPNSVTEDGFGINVFQYDTRCYVDCTNNPTVANILCPGYHFSEVSDHPGIYHLNN